MINRFLLLLLAFVTCVPAEAQQQTYSKDYYFFNYPDSQTGETIMRYAVSQVDAGCTAALAYVDAYGKYSTTYTHWTNQPSSKDIFCYGIRKPDTVSKGWIAGYFRTCVEAYFDPFLRKCTNTPPSEPNPCNDKNPMIRRYNYSSPPYVSPDHFGACKVTPLEMLTCGKDASGVQYCFWKIVRTGEAYTGLDNNTTGSGSNDPATTPPTGSTPTPSPPITPPPAPPGMCSTCRSCPAGTVQAGIGPDGVPMCVGTGTNPPPPPTTPTKTTNPPTKTTAADGTTTTTQVTSQPNKDGSTTTTTTTTITKPDGTSTTSVGSTVSNSTAGSPGSTDKPGDDDKYNLCKQNPTLSICRESSVSGTCGQITCVGDAIQCSTLRAAALMQCQQQKDIDDLNASPQKALGASILSGADPMKGEIETMLKGSEIDLSKPSLDDAGFLGGGSCLANRTITVLGKPVQVNFTELCTNIQPLRAVIMAVAFLAAYMLVSRSVLQS